MTLPEFEAPDLTVGRITRKELPALIDFCASCSAFFEMTGGERAAKTTAEELLVLAAPGKNESTKHLLGFSRHGQIVAVADLAEDYPNAHDWYVALLLLIPSARGAGLGTWVWNRIETWIRTRDGHDVRLIVQQQNAIARYFWEANGFAVVDESIQRVADRENRIWSMLRPG